MGEQTVIGHYVAGQDGSWQPALQQSSDLFKALVADDLNSFEQQLSSVDNSSSFHTVLYWSGSADSNDAASPKVEAKSRTLAMLATHHSAVRVLSYLLSKGCDPKLSCSKDGLSCYEFVDSNNPNAGAIRGMLNDAAGNWASSDPAAHQPAGNGPEHAGSHPSSATDAGANGQLQAAQGGGVDDPNAPYSTSDLTRPEYSTDWFRMYCFKVLRCSKRYAHDWRACPFAHPTENARRRDPRDFKYSSLVCPDYRQGCCVRGDTCQYAHGVFESWLHPSRYRTQLCKDHEKCDRPVCFFAHSLEELRTPENSFVPGPEERLRVPEAMQVVLGLSPPAAAPQLQSDTARTADQNLELLMQRHQQHQQALQSGGSASALNRAASSNASLGSGSQQATSAAAGGAAGGDDQQQQQAAGSDTGAGPVSSSGTAAQPSPKQQQLVSPTAMPMPRMSNAFARKHGLDPKENPLINLQRLAMQQVAPPAPSMANTPFGGRRNKRGGGGQQHVGGTPQGYSPQQHFQQQQQQQQQQFQQVPAYHHQQQLHSPAHPPPLLQPLSLQQHQLLQPQVLSPAAANAVYYGSPSPLQHMQHSPASPMLDPQAMALLFGGMSIAGPPLSPADPTGAIAAGMHSPHQLQAYAMGAPSPTIAVPAAGMLSPVGALTPAGTAAALGAQSPLPQPMMHPASALHSPQPHF